MSNCPKILTASRFAALTTCARKHFYRYEMGLEVDIRSEALLFGSSIHKGLEVWWKSKTEKNPTGDASGAMNAMQREMHKLDMQNHYGAYACKLCEVMLTFYMGKYMDSPLVGVEVEREFLFPMPTAKGDRYKDWKISGKIDCIVKDLNTDKYYLLDHKTASERTNLYAGALYWNKLAFDKQISMYWVAAELLGYEIDGFIYDVLKKPNAKPRLETPLEKRKFKRNGELYSGMFDKDESIEEYTERIASELHANINENFVQKTIARDESEIESFLMELQTAAAMIDNTTNERQAIRNASGCYSYGKDCPYLGACMGGSTDLLEGVRFIRPFEELDELDDSGNTNS